ncbi:MAG TPA: hypothetical protein VF219_09710 [Vicinamibacterales bacterium]
MIEVEGGLFTVAVFQNAAWAVKGIDALKQAGFPPDALSLVAKESAESAPLFESTFGGGAERLDVVNLGAVLAKGRLLEALQGSARDLAKLGISGTMRRVGFQPHDGRIFESLLARGGILVAIRSEPRAADALTILHSYGGGNAAIGAWSGRV